MVMFVEFGDVVLIVDVVELFFDCVVVLVLRVAEVFYLIDLWVVCECEYGFYVCGVVESVDLKVGIGIGWFFFFEWRVEIFGVDKFG